MSDLRPLPTNGDKLRSYLDFYQYSLSNESDFWLRQAKLLAWERFPSMANESRLAPSEVVIRWFADGALNAAYNCVGRHAQKTPDRIALYWEPDDPRALTRQITYAELEREVHQMAGILRHLGIQKGDRVAIYLPMIPEAVIAMLACAQIGAVHTVVFGGFSAQALRLRLEHAQAKLLLTTPRGQRGGKTIPLYEEALKAIPTPGLQKLLLIDTPEMPHQPQSDLEVSYQALRQTVAPYTTYPPMQAEDPLFILYTSGSTGKPKGLLHTTGGYLVYATYTFQLVFDYQPQDIYFCTADLGWITGHSYLVYGPLSSGATQVFFAGTPTHPTPARLWEIVDKYGVSLLYTSPTAIRTLMREGDHWVRQTSRHTLRLLGSVGEPINPEAWQWYYRVVGAGRCAILDTWWQTETGGICISPLPRLHSVQKPGSATYPLPGIQAALLDAQGREIEGPGEGILVLKGFWPGQARVLWGDPKRFYETYFAPYPGYFYTGDGARRDEEGCLFIIGRIDDVLNVSGHRLGTAEIESALVSHPAVAEAAVVGFPHPIKGEGIYAFAVLRSGYDSAPALTEELVYTVRQTIGPIAKPDHIQFVPDLPKTRSGKIMRRILRKIVRNENDFGDISTLANPEIVSAIWETRKVIPS